MQQSYLTPDFAADMKYKPRIAALEAENKSLKQLMRKIVNIKVIEEIQARSREDNLISSWLAHELGATCRMLDDLIKGFQNGEDISRVLDEAMDFLAEADWEGGDNE